MELYANEMRYGDDYLPFAYTSYSDGSLILRFLPDLKDFALEFIKSSDLFSENAIGYVYKNISDYMKNKFNLEPDVQTFNYYKVSYGLSDINNLNLNKKQDSSIRFDGTCGHEIIEKYAYTGDNSLFFGTLADNKIVSAASWNSYETYARYPETIKIAAIGAGTHEDYRGRGYAVSNVVALAEYILSKGIYARYNTDSANKSSRKTAEAAGFAEMSRGKLFWFKNKFTEQ
jgi:GNAT superfamily N-acetyltransferase